MSTPYAFQTSFTCTGGTPVCVQLNVPQRGVIRSVKIRQLSGSAADATAAIYSKHGACPGNNSSSSACGACEPGIAPDLGDPELYRITPDLDVVGGSFLTFEKVWCYCNRDGRGANRLSRLYLGFLPEGSGDQEWGMTMELEDATYMG